MNKYIAGYVITCEDQDGNLVWHLDSSDLSDEEQIFIYGYAQNAAIREDHPLLDNRLSFTGNSVAALRLYLAEFNFRVALKNTPLSYEEQLGIRSAARSAAQNWEG